MLAMSRLLIAVEGENSKKFEEFWNETHDWNCLQVRLQPVDQHDEEFVRVLLVCAVKEIILFSDRHPKTFA